MADCDSACSADKLPPVKCSNGGLCIDHILYFDCDCKGTGYEGTYCAKGKWTYVIMSLRISIQVYRGFNSGTGYEGLYQLQVILRSSDAFV